MTPEEEKILITLVGIHRQQANDSSYFDPINGGVYSNDLGCFIYMTGEDVENIAKNLGQYLILLDRGNPKIAYKGLQATQAALDWVDAKSAAEKQARMDVENQEAIIAAQAAQLETDLAALKNDPLFSSKLEIAVRKIIERLIILKKY